MSEQSKVLVRMCDVIFSLGVADIYGLTLNRIRLQKFIYLLDVVGYLYEILPPLDAHRTYRRGPYDSAIQNAVDSLAFRGLTKVLNVTRSKDDKAIHAEYSLSDAGKLWLKKLRDDAGLKTRWEAALEVAHKVNARGWDKIVAMVYAEPTYFAMRPRGYGQRLQPDNGLENSAAFIMRILDYGLSHGFKGKKPSKELMIEMFFRYLDNYSQMQSHDYQVNAI